MKYYLAIDIGASSGRLIVGYLLSKQEIATIETYRFSNFCDGSGDTLTWDIERIFNEILTGLTKTFAMFPKIESLAIDTWGVDYALLNGDQLITPVYAYRSNRTLAAIEEVETKISFSNLYERTGCQFQKFNSIYQLVTDLNAGRLEKATDFLMIPEYLTYLLTGQKVKEYTNASTAGLLNLTKKDYDQTIINRLNLPNHLFSKPVVPPASVGTLRPEIAKIVGGNTLVKLCASHDTASAIEALDNDYHDLYLSSGTWSLLGVKTSSPITCLDALKHNFSNEAGPNYIRFQKNIMGLWMIQCLEQEYKLSFQEMIALAKQSEFTEIVNVNDESFLAPKNMELAIIAYLKKHNQRLPEEKGDVINSVFHSLAESYRAAIEVIEKLTNKKYRRLTIIGGGAKNEYLNELTARYTKKEVIALPIEASAIGNLKNQMEEIDDGRKH